MHLQKQSWGREGPGCWWGEAGLAQTHAPETGGHLGAEPRTVGHLAASRSRAHSCLPCLTSEKCFPNRGWLALQNTPPGPLWGLLLLWWGEPRRAWLPAAWPCGSQEPQLESRSEAERVSSQAALRPGWRETGRVPLGRFW